MDIASQEAEAKAKAAKHVANMLHAPDKLEKVRRSSVYCFIVL